MWLFYNQPFLLFFFFPCMHPRRVFFIGKQEKHVLKATKRRRSMVHMKSTKMVSCDQEKEQNRVCVVFIN